MTSQDHEELIAREKPYADTALPSGNSIQAHNLLRLCAFTTDHKYQQRAGRALTSFSSILSDGPAAMSEMLLAVEFYLDAPLEIIIVTPGADRNAGLPFLKEFNRQFIPNRILVVVDDQSIQAASRLIPLVREKSSSDGKAMAFVCKKGACKMPAADPAVFARQLSDESNLIIS